MLEKKSEQMSMERTKEPLLSVIIPVYKTEEFLERCIQSMKASEYHNLEIILIDDGSPDQCPKLCDDYAREDNRIQVYHKENGGVHTAKNMGLAVARGTYVTFCDSDDCVPPQAYQALMQKAAETDADVVLGNIRRIYTDTGDTRVAEKSLDNLSNLVGGHTGNVYKKELLQKHDIKIGSLKMGEGLCFMIQVLNHTDRIEYIPDVTYDYYIRPANAKNQSAMQMQFKNFGLYYDDFLWRKWLIAYAMDSEKLMKRYGDQLTVFCKVINDKWLGFEKEQREKCFSVLQETVALLVKSGKKEEIKGYIQTEPEKLLAMSEKQYTKHLTCRFKVIEPIKRILKRQ